MKTKIVGLALLASISGAAAADLPRAAPAYSKSPVMAPAYNWTGFYVGAMGGYGWSERATLAGVTGTTNEIKGGFAGGTVGYNWQAPGSQFVFGLEGDAAWSDIKFRTTALGITFEDKIQTIGSITGRIGWAADAALFYIKGGYAFAENKMSFTNGVASLSESRFHSGWTVGGGLEYGFTPNWSAKGEYMYASFANENYLTAVLPPAGINFGVDIHTVKFGVNYRFGGGPVVARY